MQWTPDVSGSFAVSIDARDPRGGVPSQSYTLAVANVNDAPVITTSPAFDASLRLQPTRPHLAPRRGCCVTDRLVITSTTRSVEELESVDILDDTRGLEAARPPGADRAPAVPHGGGASGGLGKLPHD